MDLPRSLGCACADGSLTGALVKVLIDGSSASARGETSDTCGHAWLMRIFGCSHGRWPARPHPRVDGSGLASAQPGRTSGTPSKHSIGKRRHAGAVAARRAPLLPPPPRRRRPPPPLMRPLDDDDDDVFVSLHSRSTSADERSPFPFSPRRSLRPSYQPSLPPVHSHELSGAGWPTYHSQPHRHDGPPQKLNSFFEPSAVTM